MSFRNRCQIAGAEGVINLSIPLRSGRDQRTLVKDVKISDRIDWQGQHWKTILSCYRRSPWLEFYEDGLRHLYEQPVESLFDWNLQCLKWVYDAMRMDLRYSLTDTYVRSYPEDEVSDWRNLILPKNRELDRAVRYRQVFEERTGFLPNLSILDLLFCEGKRAKELLFR